MATFALRRLDRSAAAALATLEQELRDAVLASLRLDSATSDAEFICFIGKHLAQADSKEPLEAAGETISDRKPRAELNALLRMLSARVTRALNATQGSPGWPTAAVAAHLIAGEATDDSVEAVVSGLSSTARTVEPTLTALLQSLALAFDGELLGLEHRFKADASARRKLRTAICRRKRAALSLMLQALTSDESRVSCAPSLVAPEVLLDMLRYSYVFPTSRYVAATHELVVRLKGLGFEPTMMKNYWRVPDDIYQGINSIWADAAGFAFELQIHTHESFACNVETHGEYERYRVAADQVQKRVHYDTIAAAAAAVPVPSGV
jgi:hypothetical protein